MDNNGIVAINDLYEGKDDSAEKIVQQYLENLSEFHNDTGKELLANLRKEKPEIYKNYTENQQRRYRNWQNGKNTPYRENLIELCFDYQITELDKINNLLWAFDYEALHLRDVYDLVYYFALRNGISYDEAAEKAAEQKKKFEKEFGKESGESRRTSTGLYTRIVLENINVANSWQDLEDYIEENKSKLGRIKITAYKKAKQFINELNNEDKQDVFYKTDDMKYRELIKAVRRSMGLPEKNEEKNEEKNGQKNVEKNKETDNEKFLYSELRRTKSISRGIFILYNMKTIFEDFERNHRNIDSQEFIKELNRELDKCSFALLNTDRCLWDKIVCDCINAALDIGLYYDDNNATPYELALTFLEYIQDSEK